MKKILCVCALGKHRSKYLAGYLKKKGYSTRYGGVDTEHRILKKIKKQDVEWADLVVIIRKRLVPMFNERFKDLKKKQIIIDVTDSKNLVPKKYSYLKYSDDKTFAKEWREPQLRKAIEPYLPL